MAQYLSADNAVSVNTDTPIDISFAHSVMRHKAEPHGHDSNVYNSDANGTHMIITSKSANANENIYLKQYTNMYSTMCLKYDDPSINLSGETKCYI